MMQLPVGYSVELSTFDDDSKEWVLYPPPDVVIFSVEGEGVILFDATDYDSAMRYAVEYLRMEG